ncbi:MAG: ABC transporter substrate-binding protein [Acidobacteria bacterium]|nr:ABC transporter substrate-binding protein [Acidobacteriota bacterium]MCB9397735.1 ABC transporter substrate-binding protein [Acidobacteriota bacterium]
MTKRIFVFFTSLFLPLVFAQSPAYKTGQPLTDVVKTSKKPVASKGKLKVPLITWGGDVATIMGEKADLFKQEGLDVEVFVENNFPKQVEACLSGETPLLRGTLGMINSAAEVFQKNGLDLVVIYQMTWSNGGDAMVVRSAKKPGDLKGKSIALQLYGPHMDYAANILNSAKVPLDQVQFKWLEELTLPTFDTKGKTIDPVTAFINDSNLDATMCIIPDALALTSGGEVGTGSSGSVKGARILLSTKTASRVISDVYAVRSDYFDANKSQVEKLVHALMKSEEALSDLFANKAKRQSEYQQVMTRAADLLLGAPQAVPDIEALMGDCEFVGFEGNVSFFTGKGTTRNFDNLQKEIQSSFKAMGLMRQSVTMKNANWNYQSLAAGLKNVKEVPAAPKFDAQKVVSKVEKKISVEPTTWAEEGTLFQIEINFGANQSDFTESQYANDYQKAIEIAETYGGSLIMIEGHSDPLGILKAKQNGTAQVEISQMEQQAKNLSLERADAVRKSFLSFCKKKGLRIDESQFVAIGMGITSPKFNPPRTKEEWEANRRVVFRIKQIEAELSEFSPLE